MSKPKHRLVWCSDDWLPYRFAFCPSERAWRRAAKQYRLAGLYPQHDACCIHFVDAHGVSTTLVCVGDHIKTKRHVIGYLVHEGSHVWRQMREAMGELSPSSEFEAYSLQAIVERLIIAYEASRGPLIGKNK